MSGLQYTDPIRAIVGSVIYPGASMVVRDADGAIVPLYADPDLSAPIANPVIADASGRFAPVYAQTGDTYSVSVTDRYGSTIISDSVDLILTPLSIGSVQPRSDSGAALPYSAYRFYLFDTTGLADVYADEALTVPLENPIEANSDGDFPVIWLDPLKQYRVQLHDGNGVLIHDIGKVAFDVDGIPPTAPVLSGVLDGTDIELSWTEAVSPFNEVAGYRLYNAETDALIVDQAGRTYTDGPAVEGESYSYYVIAYDGNGVESERSNVVTVSYVAVVNIQTFTASGTWTKPADARVVELVLIGDGGGGASGSTPAHNNSGGGAGGGGFSRRIFLADSLPSTIDVIVGSGGLGASGNPGGNGISGDAGTGCAFGDVLRADGGDGGRLSGSYALGGIGLISDGGNGTLTSTPTPSVADYAPGGGGVGGRNVGGGGATGGGGSSTYYPGMGAGGSAGSPGGDGASNVAGLPGSGGGGGTFANPGAGRAGGAGGFPGGGGGGGGSGSSVGGVGGNGAGGVVIVITYF